MYTENISICATWEAAATGNCVCYLVFGSCGKGWKWLHGNGVLTETKFVCQSLTAMLGCRKYKLSILLLKGSRALPGVDNRMYSGIIIPFPKSVSVTILTVAASLLVLPLVWFWPDHFFAQLVMDNLYHVHH